MKIVFTVHTYWPNKDGVQYVTQYLAEGLAQKGHSVEVITNVSNREKEGNEKLNGVLIKRLFLKNYLSIINIGKRRFLNLFFNDAKDCDVLINCCVQSPINNVILKKLKKLTCCKILYMHGMHSFRSNSFERNNLKYFLWHKLMNARWWLFYHLNKNNFAHYNHFVDISNNSGSKEFFNTLGIHVPFSVINNAVEEFDSVPYIEEDFKYFLCVANFNERKNQIMAIKAFENIKNRSNFKLVLIGKGSTYSSMLKKYILDHQLQNEVIVYEDLERSTTKSYIKSSTCGIISSQYEVYPIFLCESIMCGKPFISTDVGCSKDIPGGLIVNSQKEFTDAMQNIISNKELRIKLANQGLCFASENLSQSAKINMLENLIISLN